MNEKTDHKQPVTLFVLYSGIIGAFFLSMFIRIGLRKVFTSFFDIQGDFQVFLSLPNNIFITLAFSFIHAFVVLGFVFFLMRKYSWASINWKNFLQKEYLIILFLFVFFFIVFYAIIFYSKEASWVWKNSFSGFGFIAVLLILVIQSFLDVILHYHFFLSNLLKKVSAEDALGTSAFVFGVFALLLFLLVPLAFLNYFVLGAFSAFLFWRTQSIPLLFGIRFLYLLFISFSILHLPGFQLRGFLLIPDNSGFIGGGYFGAEGSLLLTALLTLGIAAVYWFLPAPKKN